jgi:hypothetical protein
MRSASARNEGWRIRLALLISVARIARPRIDGARVRMPNQRSRPRSASQPERLGPNRYAFTLSAVGIGFTPRTCPLSQISRMMSRGMLFITLPSTRTSLSSPSIGGKIAGIAVLARTAFQISPWRWTTASARESPLDTANIGVHRSSIRCSPKSCR